jgi:hypothetical protein
MQYHQGHGQFYQYPVQPGTSAPPPQNQQQGTQAVPKKRKKKTPAVYILPIEDGVVAAQPVNP